jgi:hypothetical protein
LDPVAFVIERVGERRGDERIEPGGEAANFVGLVGRRKFDGDFGGWRTGHFHVAPMKHALDALVDHQGPAARGGRGSIRRGPFNRARLLAAQSEVPEFTKPAGGKSSRAKPSAGDTTTPG